MRRLYTLGFAVAVILAGLLAVLLLTAVVWILSRIVGNPMTWGEALSRGGVLLGWLAGIAVVVVIVLTFLRNPVGDVLYGALILFGIIAGVVAYMFLPSILAAIGGAISRKLNR